MTETSYKSILLAASYPGRAYKAKADSHEIASAVKALAGAAFQQGWGLVFGGHPSVAPLILMIAREYGYKERIMIYQSKYFVHHISPATQALTKEGFGKVAFVPNDPSEDPPVASSPIDPTRCPKSLTAMRKVMIRHPGLSGLVLIGGDTGLTQELSLFREVHPNLPIIPIGAPGGIASDLAHELRGGTLGNLSDTMLATSRNYLSLCTWILRFLESAQLA